MKIAIGEHTFLREMDKLMHVRTCNGSQSACMALHGVFVERTSVRKLFRQPKRTERKCLFAVDSVAQNDVH